ncbi:MAG: hypothetical protein AAF968_03425 [Pseudomonadota bacterium]
MGLTRTGLALAAAIGLAGGALGAYLGRASAEDQVPPPPSRPDPIGSLSIIDGDTIRRNDEAVRLVGFDTPEATAFAARGRDGFDDGAWCPAEGRMAAAATGTLRRLMGTASHLALIEIGRGRWRPTARLEIDHRDAADLLIEAGFARPMNAGDSRRPWAVCAR